MFEKTAILSRKEVERRTSLSRSTIYRLMDTGQFPRPINLTPSRVGWNEQEIEQWIQSRLDEGTKKSKVSMDESSPPSSHHQ